jgi:exopolyphosphatase/pppGpp-phosphohydrolase
VWAPVARGGRAYAGREERATVRYWELRGGLREREGKKKNEWRRRTVEDKAESFSRTRRQATRTDACHAEEPGDASARSPGGKPAFPFY